MQENNFTQTNFPALTFTSLFFSLHKDYFGSVRTCLNNIKAFP